MARARATERRRFGRPVRHTLSGDLDAIVMMALRKDAGDRYGSVDLLWEDLQRYLDGLPVHAHRGSRLYRARKFLGRYRVESTAAAVVALSLAVSTGVAVRQATLAARDRDRAQHALAQAEQSLEQSESVTGFLVGLFDAAMPTPGSAVFTVEELVRRGTTQIESLSRTATRAGPHARGDGARVHDDGPVSRGARRRSIARSRSGSRNSARTTSRSPARCSTSAK